MKYPQHGKFNPKHEIDSRKLDELHQQVMREKWERHEQEALAENEKTNETKFTSSTDITNSN